MHYQHKFKCLNCGLHFVVCSDFEDWPNRGTTREMRVGESTGVTYCPECGGSTRFIHWREQVDELIFQTVPGKAELHNFIMRERSGEV
jgi:transcription elongation factor Elf1